MKSLIRFFFFFGFVQLHALKIAVVSIAAGEDYQQAVYPGFVNKQAYCKTHGYDFFYITESLDPSRPYSWSKIKAIEKILINYDWVFWTDADSLIMNPSIALENLIDDRYFLIICKQSDNKTMNAGQFLIKNEPIGFDFLEEVYRPELIDKGFYEQGAVNIVLSKRPFSKRVLCLHQRAMNSIWGALWGGNCADVHYHVGDFILHFMGSKTDELRLYMKKWSDFLEANKEKICLISPDHLRKRASCQTFDQSE
jgi:hypothetical protein